MVTQTVTVFGDKALKECTVTEGWSWSSISQEKRPQNIPYCHFNLRLTDFKTKREEIALI